MDFHGQFFVERSLLSSTFGTLTFRSFRKIHKPHGRRLTSCRRRFRKKRTDAISETLEALRSRSCSWLFAVPNANNLNVMEKIHDKNIERRIC